MKPILAVAVLLHLVCLSLAARPALYSGQEDVPKYYYGALEDVNEERIPLKEHNVTNCIIPRYFDAREHWPQCPSIREIRDQASCGSCWAVAAAATMTDRVCTYSNGSQQFHFSSENILACCPQQRCCGKYGGCDGGQPLTAWEMYMEQGIVSGGEYGTYKGCQPYEIPHGRNDSRITPSCHSWCQFGYYKQYEEDLHFGQGVYRLIGEMQMQFDIMFRGPIQASFDVYEDYDTWDQKGVYVHTGGKKIGGHSVKVIGWGEEKDGTPFWIVANSYGRQWGEGGFFKFLRGSNQCHFEEQAVAGIPKL